MLEKNIKKQQAKKYRVWFDGKMGILDHESVRHPNRQTVKKDTRKIIRED